MSIRARVKKLEEHTGATTAWYIGHGHTGTADVVWLDWPEKRRLTLAEYDALLEELEQAGIKMKVYWSNIDYERI